MSNYLAIAAVTVTLRDLLQQAVQSVVLGADVTYKRPERMVSDGQDKPSINLYLYQVAPNPTWSNDDLPTRNSRGMLVQKPQVAMDLYYLLSFHGSELDMEPQRLLGSAVMALHTRPVLDAAAIELAKEGRDYLQQSDLALQIERVKLSPLNLTLEELSKLWSVFFQIPYTLSIAYKASAVLIDADVDIQESGIVTKRRFTVRSEVTSD